MVARSGKAGIWAFIFQDSNQEMSWEKEKEKKREWGEEKQEAGMAVAPSETLSQKEMDGECPVCSGGFCRHSKCSVDIAASPMAEFSTLCSFLK